MSKCFVIQPFDGAKFDKRFDDVFAPAIEEAGLVPYRVDRDPNVDVPIEAIENGIAEAAVCLADITTDNPNVWYELGYASALSSPVVMVCSDERTGKKFPFDIQHRAIITYQSESSQDFVNLQKKITDKIKALLSREQGMREVARGEKIAPVDGLTQVELAVLGAIAGTTTEPDASISLHMAKSDVQQAGFTPVGFNLGVRRLQRKGFINVFWADDQGEAYQRVRITDNGWDWVEQNESKFLINKPETDRSPF